MESQEKNVAQLSLRQWLFVIHMKLFDIVFRTIEVDKNTCIISIEISHNLLIVQSVPSAKEGVTDLCTDKIVKFSVITLGRIRDRYYRLRETV